MKHWLVALLVAAAWWPVDTYWLSDDFVAVTYVQDSARAFADLTQNQYGLQGLLWFWRPLFTLSFWLESLVGSNPFVSHLSNTLLHALAAMLLSRIVERFLGAGPGFWTGLVWGTAPLHAGSVLWAVGRVDSHTTFWILASAWMFLRDRRFVSLLAFVFALMSKELAIVTPGIVTVLGFAAAAKGERSKAALRGAWPHFLVLAVYLAWRWFLFERLGGYEGGPVNAEQAIVGLQRQATQVLSPGGELYGLLPALVGVVWMIVRRRLGALTTCAVLFVGAALPMLQFWAIDDSKNLRYFTLPSAPLLALAAGGSLWTAIPMLALQAPPYLAARAAWREAHHQSRVLHRQLIDRDPELPAGPLFVHGLARTDPTARAILFHFGADRLLQPPFASGARRVFALRPLPQARFAFGPGLAGRSGLPAGVTLEVTPELTAVLPPVRGSLEASLDCDGLLTSQALWDLHQRRRKGGFVIRGDRVSHYRITLFTAGGWLTAILPDESPPDAGFGYVSLSKWLQAPVAPHNDDAFVLRALQVPAITDLEPHFPVWIEAGTGTPDPLEGQRFKPLASARGFVWLTFERDFAEFVAGRVPDGGR